MSVTYRLNLPVKVRELKENGFEVVSEKDDEGMVYPTVIKDEEYDSVLSVVGFYYDPEVKEPTEDDIFLTEFEGRFSHGGGICMLRICDKLDRKFITDEDIDNLFMASDTSEDETLELTDKIFEFRTNDFREYFKNEQSN